MKKAFTMIELVMVIVVLGIVAAIGADIIVSLYNNYLRTRTINALETKTEATLEQIAKRFQYRIKDSTIARQANGAFDPISLGTLDHTYKTIEWIGYSNESFLGTPRPGWSGFIDFDANETNKTAGTLKTTDSNLSYADEIINALSYGNISLNDDNETVIILKNHGITQTLAGEIQTTLMA